MSDERESPAAGRIELEVPVDDPTTGPTPPPARSQKRGPKVKLNKPERELRGQMIMARRLAGERMDSIAKVFDISTQTAYKALGDARRTGIFEQARDFVTTHLLPKALAVYDQALDEMNVEVARDVLQGLGLVGRQLKIAVEHDVKEDFDAWRLKKAQAIEVTVAEILPPSESTPLDAHPSTDPSDTPHPSDGLPGELTSASEPATMDSPSHRAPDGEDSLD